MDEENPLEALEPGAPIVDPGREDEGDAASLVVDLEGDAASHLSPHLLYEVLYKGRASHGPPRFDDVAASLRIDQPMRAYTTPKHILVPHDFSDTAEAALSYAMALAPKLGARITVLNVFELPSYGYGEALGFTAEILGNIQRAAEEGVKFAAEQARNAGLEVTEVVRQGAPWSEIDAVAKEMGVDLIVMGTHGRQGLSRAFLGSVTEKVVRTAPCPVMAIRGGSESAP